MDVSKLVAALERADEGSEYLDYTIQRRYGLMKPVPAYTRSLDAAMTLIPEGWSIFRLQRRNDCRGNFNGWMAELYRASDVVIEIPSLSSAATAPLAIAAAALRVLETLEAATSVPADSPAMRLANGVVAG
jgi:hypothetical protein